MNEISECVYCGELYSHEGDIHDEYDDEIISVPMKKKLGDLVICPNSDCEATIGDSFCQWLIKYASENTSQFLCVSKNCDCCPNPYACGNTIGITDELLYATGIEDMNDHEFWVVVGGDDLDYVKYYNSDKATELIKNFIIQYLKLCFKDGTYDWYSDIEGHYGELLCEDCIEQRREPWEV